MRERSVWAWMVPCASFALSTYVRHLLFKYDVVQRQSVNLFIVIQLCAYIIDVGPLPVHWNVVVVVGWRTPNCYKRQICFVFFPLIFIAHFDDFLVHFLFSFIFLAYSPTIFLFFGDFFQFFASKKRRSKNSSKTEKKSRFEKLIERKS